MTEIKLRTEIAGKNRGQSIKEWKGVEMSK